jgi:ribosomal-protein-alanine N-acetyltransferase
MPDPAPVPHSGAGDVHRSPALGGATAWEARRRRVARVPVRAIISALARLCPMGGHGGWLATERLALRRFTAHDLDWLSHLYGDADFAQYLGGPKTPAQVQSLLTTRILDYYDAHPGLGIWMTMERASGQPLGFHLLNHIQGESFIQVGFGLSKPVWGRGLATEMAFALLRYGFVDLRLDRIVGMASLGNLASQRVLEKIGLRRRGKRAFAHPAYAAQGMLAWFERDGTEWTAERGDHVLPGAM